MTVPADWWQEFFHGIALECWWRVGTPEYTRPEVDFIEQELALRPPAHLLDVPCGNGRHARELARRGYRVIGVDLAAENIAAAQAQSTGQENLAFERRDMRDLPWREEFDGAFSFGNSFGYLDDAGNVVFLQAVGRVLKPEARFVLDAPMTAESLLPNFQERRWYPIGDILFLVDQHYDPATSRVEAEYSFIQGGKVDKRGISQRVYFYRELSQLLEAAGFGDLTAYGSLSREPFRLGAQRLLLSAVKKSPSSARRQY
jgi:SAM-dependent methyltransferase